MSLGGATVVDGGLLVTSGGLTVSNGDVNLYGNLYISGVQVVASDRRLKTDIVPLDDALDKINQLRGMKYSWIQRPADEKGGIVLDSKRHVGVFAQDVEAVLPEAVQSREGFGSTYLAVEYQALIPLLIEAVRELSAANNHGSTARQNNATRTHNATEVNILAADAAARSNDVALSTIAGEEEEPHRGSKSSSDSSSGRISSDSSLATIAAAVKLLQEENKVLRDAVSALQRDTEQLHRRCDERMIPAA